MRRYIFMLDPGHGGVIDGIPQTEGKRSPFEHLPLYEGEFNRAVVRRVLRYAVRFGVTCINLVSEEEDISLTERVNRAHDIMNSHPDAQCVYVSIHANAGGGKGFEVFTSPGETDSDRIASVFIENLSIDFPEITMRQDYSDGDPDKEAPFYVLTKTAMPAVLIENFFMDNEEEVRDYLLDDEVRLKLAYSYCMAMDQIQRRKT